ncbi:hypothetical protein K6V98_00125 [Collinsella sp. AGMB00827]|uniref:DUF2746 domain-containing protein n=1 Tax=Collinsella ureilytica TaxID=2869515 RepID=A0ABS7MI47_9ACTN|nr:hypothetical protein [Collinsella urealyticum]MBY4796776.1 hypothetical protein [Collinsella urealyticum]
MEIALIISAGMFVVSAITLALTLSRDRAAARERDRARAERDRAEGANWQAVKAKLGSIESVGIDTRGELRDVRNLLTDHTAQLAEMRSQIGDQGRRIDRIERRCENRCLPIKTGGTD